MKTNILLALLLGLCFTAPRAQAQGCTTQLSTINENFNAIAHGAIPTCWTRHTPSIGSDGFNGTSNTNFRHNMIWLNINGAPDQLAPKPFILVMQRCTMLGPVSFKLSRTLNTVWQWPVEVGTMSDPNNPNTFVPLYAYYPTSATQVAYSVDLSGYAGTDEYIAFRAIMSDGNSFTLDDITFSGPPPIAPPALGPKGN
jgi:hypothetical protein